MARDIESVRSHVGDSYEFYRAMQQRAIYYRDEIHHHFGDHLFPEGACAPTTPAEFGSREWKYLVARARIQLDLLCMALRMHNLATKGLLKLLRNKE